MAFEINFLCYISSGLLFCGSLLRVLRWLIDDMKYIVSLDQGTTSSRAILFNKNGEITGCAQQEFTQHYPQPGWVEHDPVEIWETQRQVLQQLLEEENISAEQVSALGITNQRETTVIWDKQTGKPVYNAIVWQCRRTVDICEELKEAGLESYIQKTTGLVLDAYFSATKIKWILDNVPGARDKADKGDLLFGTVDSWLLWNLTDRKVHVTDVTNASRTMLFDIHKMTWDQKLLDALDIPASLLPEVKSCSEIYGTTQLNGCDIPIAGIAGDQQAALFGQMCHSKGMAKNTYGTGCFLLMNTGESPVLSNNGLLTTIACSMGGKVTYALEGSVFMGGASIQWLRDELGIVKKASDTEAMARSVPSSNGVYVVPAFVGLGAPYWDPNARGAILGLTRGSNNKHIARATLEAIAYQSRDLVEAMQQDSNIQLSELRVDGGAVANDFLMEFQADILGASVVRPVVIESTAAGAAYLAGLATGFWSNVDELKRAVAVDKVFQPSMEEAQKEELYSGWKQAVGRVRS